MQQFATFEEPQALRKAQVYPQGEGGLRRRDPPAGAAAISRGSRPASARRTPPFLPPSGLRQSNGSSLPRSYRLAAARAEGRFNESEAGSQSRAGAAANRKWEGGAAPAGGSAPTNRREAAERGGHGGAAGAGAAGAAGLGRAARRRAEAEGGEVPPGAPPGLELGRSRVWATWPHPEWPAGLPSLRLGRPRRHRPGPEGKPAGTPGGRAEQLSF